jgi:ParB family transcriptional regulator, chromosome partitioning protein
MSKQRGAWISRRGQTGADAAIDQVIDRQPQVDEHVQQLPDDWIEDSPYQARQPFSDDSIADLVQGMREAGFQGVLIVRLHSDLSKRRRGLAQLVYGHRRRAAWRLLCAERGEPCLLPVIVREVSDEHMLTIGAQENLQRQDLDPIEEAQIVAWHEHAFFDKSQAQIGALLGKSSDWVSVRSRIHKLPDDLKDRIRQRPRAISQLLELAPLYAQQPAAALALADRVVHENLTLDAIRALVRGYARPERRGTATNVQGITNNAAEPSTSTIRDKRHEHRGTATSKPDAPDVRSAHIRSMGQAVHPDAAWPEAGIPPRAPTTPPLRDGALLQEAADTLTILASRADQLALDAISAQALDQIETALNTLRRSLAHQISEIQLHPAHTE